MGSPKPLITKAEEAVAAALVRAQIRFEYEPHQFNVHLDHDVMRGFRPDFFLPDQETYIEVGRPSHKRTKLRMMRRFYPNVKVVVIANDWKKEVSQIKGCDLNTWLNEKWIEQEYLHPTPTRQRLGAREEAQRTNHEGCVQPSMRTS